MKQVDLGPAGIAANIEHYQALVIQKQNELKQAEDELIFWCLIQKEHRAQEVLLSHTQG
jgi:hypothetical protein